MFIALSGNIPRQPGAQRIGHRQRKTWPHTARQRKAPITRTQPRTGPAVKRQSLIRQRNRIKSVKTFEVEASPVVAPCAAKVERPEAPGHRALHDVEVKKVGGLI